MQRGEKAPEPSMEEILASIRKINAEEPIGSRPGPVPGEQAGGPSSLMRPLSRRGVLERDAEPPSPFSDDVEPKRSPFPLEDPLADLIDDGTLKRLGPGMKEAPGPRLGAPDPAPAAADSHRSNWPFGRATSVPPPPVVAPTTSPAATPSRGPAPPSKPFPVEPAAPPQVAATRAQVPAARIAEPGQPAPMPSMRAPDEVRPAALAVPSVGGPAPARAEVTRVPGAAIGVPLEPMAVSPLPPLAS